MFFIIFYPYTINAYTMYFFFLIYTSNLSPEYTENYPLVFGIVEPKNNAAVVRITYKHHSNECQL